MRVLQCPIEKESGSLVYSCRGIPVQTSHIDVRSTPGTSPAEQLPGIMQRKTIAPLCIRWVTNGLSTRPSRWEPHSKKRIFQPKGETAELGQELPLALQKRIEILRLKARHSGATAIGCPHNATHEVIQ
jgi:hypothetical protein